MTNKPGRPFIGAKQVNVSLTESDLSKARRIGEGSLTKGIRKAVAKYPERLIEPVSSGPDSVVPSLQEVKS